VFHIGPYAIAGRALLAPMAGITDQPFRNLCRAQGAALAVSEMLTCQTQLWNSPKSQSRLQLAGDTGVRVIQIAGSDPDSMAQAAKACVEAGAHIVDINMGCPAKKVCNKAAGSALLRDEGLVRDILDAVVGASLVPVTLKYRTGWAPETKNALRIAKLAEEAGIAALALHGRTRACRFLGEAEYDTLATVVQSTRLPVIANGDITSADKAARVLEQTGAAAVMIGRAAQGNPWIFNEINQYLQQGQRAKSPSLQQIILTLHSHLAAIHRFYGEPQGIKFARKHTSWYLAHLEKRLPERTAEWRHWRESFNRLMRAHEQRQAVRALLDRNLPLEEHAA
jgi:tRNA-dihydrouridine synthase B